MYTLDTNAIIYHLTSNKEKPQILDRIFDSYETIYVSTISELELFCFPSLSDQEAMSIEIFLQATTVVSLDSRLARVAANVRRGFGLKVPDSVIAATALVTGSSSAESLAKVDRNLEFERQTKID